MDFVKASRSKIRILQGEIWRKTRKILAAGRMSSALFGYCVYYTTAPVILQRLRPRFWFWLLFFKIIIAFFLAPWYNMIKHCLKKNSAVNMHVIFFVTPPFTPKLHLIMGQSPLGEQRPR
jgi:hypothetical protein